MTDTPISEPGDSILQWVAQNPEEVRKAVAILNALRRLEIAVTKSGVTTKYLIKLSDTNAAVSITV